MSGKPIVCPACNVAGAQPFYRADQIPVHSTVLLESEEAARNYARGNLELALCRACGFIFNHRFDATAVRYAPDLEESQHFSETFSAFARELAGEIAKRCKLGPGKRVLEIGCGKGEFLTELCRVSGCAGIGIDPAFRDDRLGESRPPELEFIAEPFGPQHDHLVGDVIVCRHTLEHMADPADFVRAIRAMFGTRRDVTLVLETPSARRILEEGAFWDVYYEHAGYFTPEAHTGLLQRCGFNASKAKLVYDDQYILQYARADGAASPGTAPHTIEETALLADAFAVRAERQLQDWRARLAEAAGAGPVALWGGASKAVALIAALGSDAAGLLVVDKNRFKQGRYLPGSAHRVLAPAELQRTPPALVIAANPIYRREIHADLAALGLSPELLALGD